jgi:signal transduction histidine kinase
MPYWVRHPRLFIKAHPMIGDSLLTLLLVVPSLIGVYTVDPTTKLATALDTALALGSSAPLLVRRRHPSAVLAIVMLCQTLAEIVGRGGAEWFGVVIAAYSLGAYAETRVRFTAGVWLVFLIALTSWGVAAHITDVVSVVLNAVLFGACVESGIGMRSQRQRAADLVERAERAERESDLLAATRVQHERTRIAREMHDVVAHSLSVMVIQAAAARRLIAKSPAVAEETLLGIEATGRQAMHEMRQVLGVLRDDADPTRAPQPSLDQLAELCAADPQLPVRLDVLGDIGAVPPSAGLNAYRVVQEALTNVRRHGGKVDAVDVRVIAEDGSLLVEVSDNGRGTSMVGDRRGFGITGMAERVAAFGGELMTGPRQGGGWRVRATFPKDAAFPVDAT